MRVLSPSRFVGVGTARGLASRRSKLADRVWAQPRAGAAVGRGDAPQFCWAPVSERCNYNRNRETFGPSKGGDPSGARRPAPNEGARRPAPNNRRRRSGIAACGCRPWDVSLFQRAAFPWLGHALVKSPPSARICRNMNKATCFYDIHALTAIGFVWRIFADFARFTRKIPVPIRRVGDVHRLRRCGASMDMVYNSRKPVA